jgi:molecular chaperone GrpE
MSDEKGNARSVEPGKVQQDAQPTEGVEPTATEHQPDAGANGPASAAADAAAGNSQRTEDVQVAYQERVKQLENEISTLKDQYLRKQADFENFRKRMQREKQESIKYGNSGLLLDLVGIIDDFERAIKSSEDSRDFEAFHSGIVLIEKQFTTLLENKWGLKRFDPAGEPFDPEKHEAIAMEDSGEYDVSVVLEVFQNGYMLHDRVLRPAKVKVSNPVSPVESSSSESDNEV